MDTAESAGDTGSSLTSVVASVAELTSKFLYLESVVRDMSSKHVIGANAQWDIQGADGQCGSSVTSRESTFSDKESETNSLCSETLFGDFQ